MSSVIDTLHIAYQVVSDVRTEDDERVAVFHDESSIQDSPIAIATEDEDEEQLVWLTKAQATTIARSILGALNVPTVTDPAGITDDVSWNETAIGVAIREGLTIKFGYAKGKTGSVIEYRRLQPSSLSESHGNQIVVGYDPDRDDVRAYRLDRIKGYVAVA